MLAYECRRVWSRVITWRYWQNASTSACCRRSVTRSTSGRPTSHVNSWDMSTSWQSIQPTLSKTLSPSGGACPLLLSSRDSHVRWQRNNHATTLFDTWITTFIFRKIYLLWTHRSKPKYVGRCTTLCLELICVTSAWRYSLILFTPDKGGGICDCLLCLTDCLTVC